LKPEDVVKMLSNGCQNVVKDAGFECEPHRSRTCNLLIKRLKILFAALFSKWFLISLYRQLAWLSYLIVVWTADLCYQVCWQNVGNRTCKVYLFQAYSILSALQNVTLLGNKPSFCSMGHQRLKLLKLITERSLVRIQPPLPLEF